MTITINKAKDKNVQSIAQPVVKVKTATQALTEELVDLHSRLTESGAFEMVKRLDELKKSLQSVIKEVGADPDKPYEFNCDSGVVTFGPCTNSTEILDKSKAISLLGQETFNTLAKVGITDLKTYLSPAEIETFTQKTKGARSLKTVVLKNV